MIILCGLSAENKIRCIVKCQLKSLIDECDINNDIGALTHIYIKKTVNQFDGDLAGARLTLPNF